MPRPLLDAFMTRKNQAIQREEWHQACRQELLLALMALETDRYRDTLISITSAASLAAKLDGRQFDFKLTRPPEQV